jgi:hypothetical protein
MAAEHDPLFVAVVYDNTDKWREYDDRERKRNGEFAERGNAPRCHNAYESHNCHVCQAVSQLRDGV